jgi:hypothetical protein
MAKSKTAKKKLTSQESKELLAILEERFRQHGNRHPDIAWIDVQERLIARPERLWSIFQMEATGGEPDVMRYDSKSDTFLIVDCSKESPSGRRSLCYDREGLESRKDFKPADSVIDMAESLGIELLDEETYRALQSLGEFDQKTSSWIKTPFEIRKLGGALFCDRRYGAVFVYHNGAQSYYSARGFRGSVIV